MRSALTRLPPDNDWREAARRALLNLRAAGTSGWGYRSGTAPAAEPSALAGLALLASGTDGHPAAREAARWLATLQQSDGAVGVSARLTAPGWATADALLLWQAAGAHDLARRRASAWLLRQKGEAIPPDPSGRQVLGHDTMLVGWPWVEGTHSWVEPTALAILALSREGLGCDPRVQEGLRLIHDRAIMTGGWNCGNKSAFGRVLRPQPGPTGVALLALKARGEPADDGDATRAVQYLKGHLPGIRAAESLGWGLLGLRAWNAWPDEADAWLADTFAATVDRPDAAPRLSLLLLAAEPAALTLFLPASSL